MVLIIDNLTLKNLNLLKLKTNLLLIILSTRGDWREIFGSNVCPGVDFKTPGVDSTWITGTITRKAKSAAKIKVLVHNAVCQSISEP